MAVDDVSFTVGRGQTIGLVGESGSGKSTIGRAVLGMTPKVIGEISYGRDSEAVSGSRSKDVGENQMVFQDPYGSLNPRWKIRRSLAEPLVARGVARAQIREMVVEAIESVGLNADHLDRLPHEFSGGQRQRISIARALIARPRVLVADEAVSALDVSVQAQVLNSMKRLQRDHDVATIFISHDLSVIQFIADRVIVLYFGQIMEEAPVKVAFEAPRHPYTVALKSALPSVHVQETEKIRLTGEPPLQHTRVTGCPFASRCPFVLDQCRTDRPELKILPDSSRVACHRVAADGTAMYA
ncbi:oligopeptide/dipeptide ABC transporter ATP-binding protein [Microbacterium paludicola]|uniref:oligopeptide/dipeptide ABC transporter ATP-binding protein n=1 Tax=Microbacterium paludicola TaxID=300019 RepID=UPI001431DFC5|nr:oligopeptide/dipeptide ABC transporter ATP-binding protein [Microbacterium paludicola]MBF0816586.1 ATP-binding cassette domain-containing protein [Microbacterium paludicola]